jgi:hypothetical protein
VADCAKPQPINLHLTKQRLRFFVPMLGLQQFLVAIAQRSGHSRISLIAPAYNGKAG